MTTYPRPVSDYTALVTSEHATQPDFLATIKTLVQPLSDIQTTLTSIPGLMDIDVAVGDQLDKVGEWVGISRFLTEPITGVYFAWDTVGLGWEQGAWQGPFDPSTELDALDDAHYRILLYAKRLLNIWNGSIPQAYAIYAQLIGTSGAVVGIQDTENMAMYVALISTGTLDAITVQLIQSINLEPRPAGVGLQFIKPSVPGPMFGFDITNSVISGWDVGAWATDLSGSPI